MLESEDVGSEQAEACSGKVDGKRCFSIEASDGLARKGRVVTPHGSFQTPAFMPVGTQGTVKAVDPRDLKEVGAEIVLSNTYHLHLRPGDQLIKELGGLHRFMNWNGPILTDSGGFQVYSLSGLRSIDRSGVTFRSHIDGAKVFFSPEKVVEIQSNLGVDIMMVLDECLPHTASHQEAARSLELTTHWAKMSLDKHSSLESNSLIFGIVQGGMFVDLRAEAAGSLTELPFSGYAIGGLSVGEDKSLMYAMTEESAKVLPRDKVRYLMGVGMPEDIVKAVSLGVDMFDCVIPTRSARFGRLFVGNSYMNIRNSRFRQDQTPVEEGCDCYGCRSFSRAYLSHLFHSGEILGIQLATIHNLRYYQRLMQRIREAIVVGELARIVDEFRLV